MTNFSSANDPTLSTPTSRVSSSNSFKSTQKNNTIMSLYVDDIKMKFYKAIINLQPLTIASAFRELRGTLILLYFFLPHFTLHIQLFSTHGIKNIHNHQHSTATKKEFNFQFLIWENKIKLIRGRMDVCYCSNVRICVPKICVFENAHKIHMHLSCRYIFGIYK